jgi:hypothetical protein
VQHALKWPILTTGEAMTAVRWQFSRRAKSDVNDEMIK